MKSFIVGIIALLVFNSCQKDISFDGTLNHTPRLFIEGLLSPNTLPQIYLSNSVSFFNEKVKPQEIFARDALVEITSPHGTDRLLTDSTFDQFRCRWVPFYQGSVEVEYGKTYELFVNYNDRSYYATTTIDQPKVNLSDVKYIPEFFDVYGGHDGVIIQFTDAIGEGNAYRFQMDRWIDNTRLHAHVLDVITSKCTQEGELSKVSDYGRTIFKDAAADGQKMEFNVEVSFEYLKGDTATIYLQSLDNKSAQFFQDLDNQLQSILNPFVEPTFIHSTIEGAFGVFGSVVNSDPVLFEYPQDNP